MVCNESLKKVLEKDLGKALSQRQWQRVRYDYLKGKVNLSTVKTYARLRKINGRRRIGLAEIERLEGFNEFAKILDGEVQGRDILEAFKRLKPTPSETTIRRWGNELGVPLIKNQWYTAEEAQVWIRFVGDRVRFKFPENAIKRKV